jgi:hypothetical protein
VMKRSFLIRIMAELYFKSAQVDFLLFEATQSPQIALQINRLVGWVEDVPHCLKGIW